MAVDVELIPAANREENLDFDQFVFLGRADAIAEIGQEVLSAANVIIFVIHLSYIGRIFENFQTSQLMKNRCKILIYR
ncbi:MAG: hypothetical protein BHV66_04200 [Alistipes putredinis]|uniref:Uncharacterized protein n=1 Tax=Alistipes putredinis TaxID=28117 RepID=A0A1Q6F8Q0_9BACT|nr:MAG: hypothetical protein BHV66_04200 [Alistipes putredinis]